MLLKHPNPFRILINGFTKIKGRLTIFVENDEQGRMVYALLLNGRIRYAPTTEIIREPN